MADSEEALETKQRLTVGDLANRCLESFQQCLDKAAVVHPRELSRVEDQIARFSTWAAGIGVFALGRASMDHRLRFAPEVQSVVTGLLESLNYRVIICSDVLKKLDKQGTTTQDTSIESIEQPLTDVGREISLLNKISNTIRRAGKETQTLKASDFQIKNDGENVEPVLLQHFEHHLRDRFPDMSEKLLLRLTRAMLLRRKRILYRRHKQGNGTIQMKKAVVKGSITLPAARETESTEEKFSEINIQMDGPTITPSHIYTATTLAPDKFKLAASSPSVVSASNTIALGNHENLVFPPAPGFVSKQKYQRLKKERTAHYYGAVAREEITSIEADLKLEHTLSLDLQAIGEITCPYCLYAIPAREMFDENKWHHHVKSDLDPYVCLFENCGQEEVLFNHAEEWLSHMREHAKFWRCSSHRELGSFSSRELYIAHLREVHHSSLNDPQLRALANRNCRKETKLFKICPLCGYEDSDTNDRLEDHIAGHLRSLALKSLPSYMEDIPDDADSIVDSAALQPRSRSTVNNMITSEESEELRSQQFWDKWECQITERNDLNFLGVWYFELDPSHPDSWVSDWDFEGLHYLEPLTNLEDDPILQSIRDYHYFQIYKAVIDDSLLGNILTESLGTLSIHRRSDRWKNAYEFRSNSKQFIDAKLCEGIHDEPQILASRHLDYLFNSRPREAEKILMHRLETLRGTPRKDHRDTLKTMDMLVSLFEVQGRWKEAENLQIELIKACTSIVGGDYSDKLLSMENLAFIYENQGRLEEAEKLQLQVLETYKIQFGLHHSDTLRGMDGLVSIYKSQGRKEEADKLGLQVIEYILTDPHNKLGSVSNFAATYGQGNGTNTMASANTLDIDTVKYTYTIAWLCSLPLEVAAAKGMLDHVHWDLPHQAPRDQNRYILGQVQGHNVVIVCMPRTLDEESPAFKAIANLLRIFKSIRFLLIIGIGGGAPSTTHDIRLGDIVVSHPSEDSSGFLYFDFKKPFRRRLQRIPQVVLSALSRIQAHHMSGHKRIPGYLADLNRKHPPMQPIFSFQGISNDYLFQSNYEHLRPKVTCSDAQCDLTKTIKRNSRDDLYPVIHYGTIASADGSMANAITRDQMSEEIGVLCFDIRAVAEYFQDFPCLVIRGISDYADSHQNRQWQGYAAAAAAAFAKELLSVISPSEILQEKPING